MNSQRILYIKVLRVDSPWKCYFTSPYGYSTQREENGRRFLVDEVQWERLSGFQTLSEAAIGSLCHYNVVQHLPST